MKHPEEMFNFVRRKLGTVEAIANGRVFGSLSDIQSLVVSCHDIVETIADFDDLTEGGYEFALGLLHLRNMVTGKAKYSFPSLLEEIEKCKSLVGKKMFK